MRYRAEIDGLRSVAVIPVILFHAGVGLFSGGFIGVDVFFVISGYLITTLILGEVSRNEFSLLRFYERRARRILPALLVVLIVCVPFAKLLLDANQLKSFSQALAAVMLFSSNILFWLQSGYFDIAAEYKPLLHTWSLAVEEQYYVFFPLLVLAVWPYGIRRLTRILIGISLISLILAQVGVDKYPSANFYLLFSRAWELLAGSLAAIYLADRPDWRERCHGGMANVASFVGLALILVAVFAYSERTPFPSVYAIAPVLGAVMVILFANPGTWVASLLGSKLPVSIGLISYSLYLWHQPIFVFAKHKFNSRELEPGLLFGLMCLMVLLAYLSWRFVEKPFRGKAIKLPVLVGSLGLTASVLFSLGVWGHFNVKQQTWITIDNQLVDIPIKFSGINVEGKNCSFPSFEPDTVCEILGQDPSLPTVVIIGDSHARVLSEALAEQSEKFGKLIDLSAWGCPFLPGVSVHLETDANHCPESYQEQRIAYLKKLKSDNLVVVAASRFPWYYYSGGFDNTIGGVENIQGVEVTFGQKNNFAKAEKQQKFLDSVALSVKTLAEIANHVYFILPPHANGWNPVSKAVSLDGGNLSAKKLEEALAIPMKAVEARVGDVEKLLLSLPSSYPNLTLVDPKKYTCDESTELCFGFKGHEFLFSDTDHLSLFVNRKLAKQVTDEMIVGSE